MTVTFSHPVHVRGDVLPPGIYTIETMSGKEANNNVLEVYGKLSGCPSQTVQTDYDHNANFSNFHSYSWGSVKTSNPLYVQRIEDAVNPDLQGKGWQLVPSGGDVTNYSRRLIA